MPVELSDPVDLLAAALVAAQAEFSAIPKESTNPFFNSKYAGLPDVVKNTTPILTAHGLAVSQWIGDDTLTTLLLHSSGQFIRETATLHLGNKDDSQAVGSAVTYMRRYAYMACLGLVADEDDDGNAAQGEQPRVARPAPAQASGDAKASEPQLKMLNAILGNMDVPPDREARRTFLRIKCGVVIEGSSKDVSKRAMSGILDTLKDLEQSGYKYDAAEMADLEDPPF